MPDRMDSGDWLDMAIVRALRRTGAPSAARQARARSALLAAASGPAHPPALHSPGLRARAVTLGARCAAWFFNDSAYQRAHDSGMSARSRRPPARMAYIEFVYSL